MFESSASEAYTNPCTGWYDNERNCIYRGWDGRCDADAGRHEGVSRISLCSRAHRPTGIIGSSGRAVCRRSVIVLRRVEEFGLEGTKKTLLVVVGFVLAGGLSFLFRLDLGWGQVVYSVPCDWHFDSWAGQYP